MMRAAVRQLDRSVRGKYRVLKLSLTVAPFAGGERGLHALIAKALQYRPSQLLG
jgi:predicted ATPase with chaperone activity